MKQTLAACLVLLVLPASAAARPGDLDPSFGVGGISNLGTTNVGRGPASMTTLDDGSVVTIPSFNSFEVVRATPGGDLDSGFGQGGEVTVDFPGGEHATAVTPGPGGTIVVAGDRLSPSADAAVARLLPDGRLDPTFGDGGMVTIDLGARESVRDVDVGADGSVVLVGVRSGPGFATGYAARLEPDGDLDPSFSGDGHVEDLDGDPAYDDEASAVELTPDGRVVVAIIQIRRTPDYGGYPAVARLLADGGPDFSFAGDGIAEVALGRTPYAIDLELDGSGASYFFTQATDASGRGVEGVAKLDAGGAPDTAFSGDGYLFVDLSSSAGGEVDADGRVLIAGSVPGAAADQDLDVEVRRLTPAGDADPSFSDDGTVITDVAGDGSTDTADGLDLDAEGRIVVGSAFHTGFLVRYLTSPGGPDADADGFPDAADLCPGRFGADPGCPHRPAASLTIEYAHRIDDFQGVLAGATRPCVEGGVVRLFRKRRGPDRRIGRSPVSEIDLTPVTPAAEGSWGVSALPRPGRYYARLGTRILPDWGICDPVRSRVMRIRARAGR